MEQKQLHTHISSKHKLLDLKLNEVWQYRDLIVLFTKRTFKVAYKQTILGPLWLFINPLLTSVFDVILFGSIARLGTDGVPMLLFYFSGNAMWGFFDHSLTGNASTFTGNAALFGKVYFPRLTIPISNVLANVFRFLIQAVFLFVLCLYYVLRGEIIFHPLRLLLIPVVLLWLGIMGMGCGIVISSMTTKYRDLNVLIGFGMRLWMYGTPVVYTLHRLQDIPVIRTLALVNPVTMPMEIYRYALLGTGMIVPASVCGSILFTLVIGFLGIIVFNRVEYTFMDTV